MSKKFIFFIVFNILLSLITTSCNSFSGNQSSTKSTGVKSYLPYVSDAELKQALDDYTNRMKALDADDISRIDLGICSIEDYHYIIGNYKIVDKKLISKWVKILKKMKLSAEPEDGSVIPGFSIIVYNTKGDKQLLGGYELPFIYNTTGPGLQKIMLHLDNYDSLKSQFEQLTNPKGPYASSFCKLPETSAAPSTTVPNPSTPDSQSIPSS